jgi:hypothetical protein
MKNYHTANKWSTKSNSYITVKSTLDDTRLTISLPTELFPGHPGSTFIAFNNGKASMNLFISDAGVVRIERWNAKKKEFETIVA